MHVQLVGCMEYQNEPIDFWTVMDMFSDLNVPVGT